MKTKELLAEWKTYLEKELLNEISIKRFQEQHPDFDITSFSSQLKGNTDYLDIISNTINSPDQNHGPEDFIQQFEFYKNSIEPNRRSQDFLTIDIPGEDIPVTLNGKLTQGSCTATYDDIQQFQQARMFVLGKGSKNSLVNAYIKVLEEANDSDFELVAENADWIIYYPKSVKGSVALARSYWDGSRIAYDNTFNSSKGYGQKIGYMKWCTSVSGSGNMFLNYHRRLNLHMYYCIKKKLRNIKDPNRKLCISFSKTLKPELKIEFSKGNASVNADNSIIAEENSKKYLGSLFDNLLKDAAREERLEIDIESYYKSISLDQYIIMRKANEENISDFQNEVSNILEYSKESNKIIDHVIKDPNSDVRSVAAISDNTPLDVLEKLSLDESETVRAAVAENINITPDILANLSDDKSPEVRARIAYNRDTPPEALENLVYDVSSEVRFYLSQNTWRLTSDMLRVLAEDENEQTRENVADHKKTPPEALRDLAEDESAQVRKNVARNFSTPSDVLENLSLDSETNVRYYVANNSNTLPDPTLQRLASDKEKEVRQNVANNRNTLTPILQNLARDKSWSVRMSVADNSNTSVEDLQRLAKDKNKYVSRFAIKNLKTKNISESTLIDYIKLMLL